MGKVTRKELKWILLDKPLKMLLPIFLQAKYHNDKAQLVDAILELDKTELEKALWDCHQWLFEIEE